MNLILTASIALLLLLWIISFQIRAKIELEQENELLTKSNRALIKSNNDLTVSNSELFDSSYQLAEKNKGVKQVSFGEIFICEGVIYSITISETLTGDSNLGDGRNIYKFINQTSVN